MFLNSTGLTGEILALGTTSITGSLFVTLLLILAFLMTVCIMFGIPLEFIAVLLLPITLSVAAYYSSFLAPLGIILIYFSMLITKNWFFK